MEQYPHPSASRLILEEDGVYGPILHQSVIARLTAGLYPLYRSGRIPYEPLPETMLAEEYAAPVPDVVLYDHQTEQARIIIEVCKNTGLKHDISKVVKLTDGELYGILEGFVYNYKTGQWLRYRLGDGGLTTETSFSDVLNLDLNGFL
ncbi:hypothetical protein F5984_02585 [Rudanella paleaurantiibacter]|uniref:Uma2 family endonuclease n=1 Tax=Rudanella paleaurantiibacter TaxID=2614655 RepID=A0A7J5U4T5_9BACT|nr:hypothetical protein [Rudanella paleaurantiibacter]KAB7732854.1 hypothetical protein F5984_02585 [Rudanella paleaurantiibacter]